MRTTPAQRKVYDAIVMLCQRRPGVAPSVREIMEECGYTSSSTIHNHLHHLKREGLVTWDPEKPRTLRLVQAAT